MKAWFLIPSALLLFACGEGDASGDAFEAAAEGAERIECAVEGATAFQPVCAVERVTGSEGLSLTIRSPSGSFRRLLVTTDGRGVVAADGAEPARVSVIGGERIEVAIGGDRYRLPATIKQ